MHLGDDAPTDMYIAKTLGQTSLIFNSAGYPNVLDFSYDENIHEGVWTFSLKKCIDRRALYGLIDCDPGFIEVEIEMVEVCKTDKAADFPECQTPTEPVDPDPVDPDPVDPDPVDPDLGDPDPVDPDPVDLETVDPEPEEPD